MENWNSGDRYASCRLASTVSFIIPWHISWNRYTWMAESMAVWLPWRPPTKLSALGRYIWTLSVSLPVYESHVEVLSATQVYLFCEKCQGILNNHVEWRVMSNKKCPVQYEHRWFSRVQNSSNSRTLHERTWTAGTDTCFGPTLTLITC
jgi:hypothetical protein